MAKEKSGTRRRWKSPAVIEKEIREKLTSAGKSADAIRFNGDRYRGNFILHMQRENDAIHHILMGNGTMEATKFIMKKYFLSSAQAIKIVIAAREVIKSRKDYEVNNLISLHVSRYDAIYKILRDMGANSLAMDAMKSIEKLIGFHKEGFYMRVSNQEVQQLSLSEVTDEYDIERLCTTDRMRFSSLLSKAKSKK